MIVLWNPLLAVVELPSILWDQQRSFFMFFFLCLSLVTHFCLSSGTCVPSVTTVNGQTACQGEQIFYENFDSLRSKIWRHEVFVPWEQDFEFCYFDDTPETSYIETGELVIHPRVITDDNFIRKGVLTLRNCTGKVNQECTKAAGSHQIIPPVRSARLSTINSFAFKYGRIEIRAKLPGGDWIVPELRLLPKRSEYGPHYESGMISIASAKGNLNLRSNTTDYGAKVLLSGLYLAHGGKDQKVRFMLSRHESSEPWYSRYHTYEIIWAPDKFQFIVDKEVVADLVGPGYTGTLPRLMNFPQEESKKWPANSPMTPFDKEFYISLGVSVGGLREFKDGLLNGDKKKPWINYNTRNLLAFYRAKNDWSSTWTDSLTKMKIQRITVEAL